MKSVSIGDILRKNNGVGPGFDLIRIGLALAILCGHCMWIAGKAPSSVAEIDTKTLSDAIAPAASTFSPAYFFANYIQHHVERSFVPMFFALSGFLVTGSAFRTRSLKTFLIFRVLRIAPALVVEVTLSALVLGPLLTVRTLQQYFSDPKFIDYFGNIIGRVRFDLPGLFVNNAQTSMVNANLWTLPSEFYCYLIVAGLMVTGAIYSRKTATILFVVATCLIVPSSYVLPFGEVRLHIIEVVYYFFCGCLIFHWRDYLPYRAAMFVISAAATYVLFFFNAYYIAPLFLSYFVILLGTTKLPRIEFLQGGDYSYGVYLYGFPITQAIVDVVPWFQLGHRWFLMATTIPLTFAFAFTSWHSIEHRALSLKHFFYKARDSQSHPETSAPRSP